MGSGDLRNVLLTGAKLSTACPKLNMHISDMCDITVARNYLLVNIVLDRDFDPAVPSNIQYLWDVWHTTQWTETTRVRFLKDLKKLIACKRGDPTILFPLPNHHEALVDIFKVWLVKASNTKQDDFKDVLDHR